jgi:hypothetical protein
MLQVFSGGLSPLVGHVHVWAKYMYGLYQHVGLVHVRRSVKTVTVL